MHTLRSLLLITAFCSAQAAAHQDRLLPIMPNGSIPDIPANFGNVFLHVTGLGSETLSVELSIGRHRTTLPACLLTLIKTSKAANVRAAGSWYHDERPGLPYYIEIDFFDDGFNPAWRMNSHAKYLFNLHNATLISAGRFKAFADGKGGQGEDLHLPPGCLPAPRR